MEKKVYLKDLVEFGSNTRKQITSKVRVSDQGVYPIGEIWDANTVIDVIVNGAHEQHDTLRELDQLAHSTQNQLVAEINRAKAAELQLNENKADKTSVYTKTEIDSILQEQYTQIINNLVERIQQLEEEIQSVREDIVDGVLIPDSITSEHIADGSIKLEDLSDEVTNKMQATVDEDEENAIIP